MARLPGAAWQSWVIDLTDVLPKGAGGKFDSKKTTQHIKIAENYAVLYSGIWSVDILGFLQGQQGMSVTPY